MKKEIVENINKKALLIKLIRNYLTFFLKKESLDKLIENIIESRILNDIDINFENIVPESDYKIKDK